MEGLRYNIFIIGSQSKYVMITNNRNYSTQ